MSPADQNGRTGEPSARKGVPPMPNPMAGTAFAAEGSPVPPLQPGGIPRIGSPAEVRPLPDGPLHFVGIGGAGQSAIAYVFAQRGRVVRGSDSGISAPAKARLESVGCEVYTQHAAENVKPDTAAVIATDAVNEQNPEITEALSRNLPVFRRPEALASLVNSARTSICVAGTHGKTTTTGMIASILIHAGLNPTVLIGGDLPLIGGNSQNGDPDLVVAEACEAYGGLDCLSPTIAVITNCEPDHLDFHGTAENFYAAFKRFIGQTRDDIIVPEWNMPINAYDARNDSPSSAEIWRYQIKTTWPSAGHDDDWSHSNAVELTPNGKGIAFKLIFTDVASDPEDLIVSLQVPGEHNVLNASAAILAAMTTSAFKINISGLESFTGTGRRFERLGMVGDIAIVDDYAHHPTEIRATLQAARQAFPGRRIVAIYQPHLPSRTRDFLDAFADALSGADALYLTDIYLAREPEQPGLIEELVERICPPSPLPPSPPDNGREGELEGVFLPPPNPLPLSGGGGAERRGRVSSLTLVKNRHELPQTLLRELKPGDVALFMGAGNIREQAEAFLTLQSRSDFVAERP